MKKGAIPQHKAMACGKGMKQGGMVKSADCGCGMKSGGKVDKKMHGGMTKKKGY